MVNSLIINRHTLLANAEMLNLLAKVRLELIGMSYLYPNFDQWLNHKVVAGIYTGERSILLELRNNLIAGIAITKDDGLEKKLCCLRVSKDFQNKSGLGHRLFERAMDTLETRNPLLSVSQDNLASFNRLFDYFGYSKVGEFPDLYRMGKTEISYNGLLGPEHSALYFTKRHFIKSQVSICNV